ncbi:MAG: hypothetical protein IIC59_08325 [Proteobacteria bacterium]|nr:hypothetical protein [Pseudomonadota bacterium]
MALTSRQLKQDVLWLKWPLIVTAVLICLCIGVIVAANLYRDSIQRREQLAFEGFDLLSGQVQAIAESERIIIENIESFNTMVANTVMDEEDRVAILSEIGTIRTRHKLFPISVQISEQQQTALEYNAAVEFPDEEISVRTTFISLSLPLLHEEDLTRFLADFLQTGRLIVTSRCNISDLALLPEDELSIVPHQIADCDFYWFTFRREATTTS